MLKNLIPELRYFRLTVVAYHGNCNFPYWILHIKLAKISESPKLTQFKSETTFVVTLATCIV